MKKLLLWLVCLMTAMTADAKNEVTTLWENTYTGNIEIPVANLIQDAVITVYATVGESATDVDRKLRLFYCKNDNNWSQTSFDGDWHELSAGDNQTYQFTVTSAMLDILNDQTENTGSRGVLYIGANNSSVVNITKITQTETITPSSTGENLLEDDWASSKETAKIFSAISGAKLGDVLQFKVSTSSAWTWVQFKITDANGDVDKYTGSGSEPQGNNAATEFTLEFVISEVADLKIIRDKGFGVIQTGDNAFTLKEVKLLTYSDSRDCVTITIDDTKFATWSSDKKYDFGSAEGITAYYASGYGTGYVRLTSTDVTWDWQGYILNAEKGSYDVIQSLTADGSYYPSGNLLKQMVNRGTVAASTGSTFHYIFAKKNDSATPAFYKLTADHTLGANKAYLETTTDIAPVGGARVAMIFEDGDATEIKTIDITPRTAENYYDLQGRRVTHPVKGIYVINGKKIVVK